MPIYFKRWRQQSVIHFLLVFSYFLFIDKYCASFSFLFIDKFCLSFSFSFFSGFTCARFFSYSNVAELHVFEISNATLKYIRDTCCWNKTFYQFFLQILVLILIEWQDFLSTFPTQLLRMTAIFVSMRYMLYKAHP